MRWIIRVSALARIERQPVSVAEERRCHRHWPRTEPLIRRMDCDHSRRSLTGEILVCLLLTRNETFCEKVIDWTVIGEWRCRRSPSRGEVVDYCCLVGPPRIRIGDQNLREPRIACTNPSTKLFSICCIDNSGDIVYESLECVHIGELENAIEMKRNR